MNNEGYNILKEAFPSLPKDKRTFDKKILDDSLLFIKSLYESIKEYSDDEIKHLMDNMAWQNMIKNSIQFLKDFGIDRTDLLNSNLSNIEIYGKLLQDMQSIIPKTNMNNLILAVPTLSTIYYVLFDVRAIDNSLRNVIVGLFSQYVSVSLGLTINDEVKDFSDYLLEHNEFSESDYKMFNEFYDKINKYNKVLNKYYDNTNTIRLLPHVLWAVFELSRSIVSSSREKILTSYNINEISEENKKLLDTYFSGFLDFYYINKDAKKNKKIILSSYFTNILEEINETLGDKKLNQGELQLLWYYIKNSNKEIMSRIRNARRKSLDIFLDECRSLYKEDNTVFESAKSRYNILKRDKEVLNEDEYSAFMVLYVFFNNKNYIFLQECTDEYSYLLIRYPLLEFMKYIRNMHSELKQNKLEKYLYDFISSYGVFFQ